jgi:hypothetical protein
MADKDINKIKIGKFDIGIVGIKQAISQMEKENEISEG